MPAGAVSVALVPVAASLPIVIGPPTMPSVAPAVVTPSWLPLTVIAGGVAVRKPKAAGAAAESVLPEGLVAWNLAPSDIRM